MILLPFGSLSYLRVIRQLLVMRKKSCALCTLHTHERIPRTGERDFPHFISSKVRSSPNLIRQINPVYHVQLINSQLEKQKKVRLGGIVKCTISDTEIPIPFPPRFLLN